VSQAKERFQDKLVAIYGMGSLGYGGYVDGWSDFDIDIILDIDYSDGQTCFQTGKEIEKTIVELGFERIDIRAYSLEHLNERDTILTYGQCSRASMLCDSARLIFGSDIVAKVKRPTREEMIQESCELIRSMLAHENAWWDMLPWDDIAAFYALVARFLYSKDTNKVAGKKLALEYFVDYYADQFEPETVQWILWALALRNKYDVRYLQECLRGTAISIMKGTFVRALAILSSDQY
jgi:hypothetical protein